MSTHTLTDSWRFAKIRLKQRYGSLTDSDLEYVEGQEEEVIGRIQKRTGAKRDEVECFFEPSREYC